MQRVSSSLVPEFSLSRIAFGLWRLTDWNYSPGERIALSPVQTFIFDPASGARLA